MASTIGGENGGHDLSPEEKNKLERKLRAEARKLMLNGKKRARDSLLRQSIEISRRKSTRADHH